MLTNFKTIKERIKRLKTLEKQEEEGLFEKLPKKEVIGLKHEIERLEKFLGGIKEMHQLPDMLFIIDPKKEKIAIREARILGIPVIGVVDTNCDPDELDIAIPGNDDAIRAVKLLTETIANAVVEAKGGSDQQVEEQETESEEA